MNKLILGLRSRCTPFQTSSLTCTIRGPKKKKGPAKVEAPLTNDIVNIFKERKDPQIYPTDRYPKWILRLLEEPTAS